MLLQSVVFGKAQAIYTQLNIDHSSNYDLVKEMILNADGLVAEAYRQNVRNCRKENLQTHVEFVRTKNSYLIGGALRRKLVLVEEFKWFINLDRKFLLDEKTS